MKYLVLIFLLGISVQLKAKDCSIIPESLERLKCNDKQTTVSHEDEKTPLKKWRIIEHVDKMDGKSSWYGIISESINEGRDDDVAMAVGCDKNKDPFFRIISDEYLGLRGNGMYVIYKFDNDIPRHETWPIKTKHIIQRHVRLKHIIIMIRKLITSRSFMIQFQPYDEGIFTSEYTLSEFDSEDIVARIQRECPSKSKYWK